MQTQYHRDGFLFLKELDNVDAILGDRLIVESEKIESSISYINEKKVKSILLSDNYYKLTEIKFINTILEIEGLYILKDKVDTSPINKLKSLRVLRLNKSSTPLDLSNFENLQVLSFDYHRNILNIDKCSKLFWLWVNGFNKDDLTEFKKVTGLEYLNLYKSTIRNLRGVENMSSLKSIFLDNVKKLESLNGLDKGVNGIKRVDIYNAPLLNNYSAIQNLDKLEQLDLRKTGEIESIKFLEKLQHLKSVTLGLKVSDGKMDVLRRIDKVGYIDYPHYNIKMKELK